MTDANNQPAVPGLAGCAVVAMVPATDLGRARLFYSGTLGLTWVDGNDFGDRYDAVGTALRVILVQGLAPAPFTVTGWVVDDIRQSIEELIRRGVAFERFAGLDQDDFGVWTAPGGDNVAWFRDPDGNVLSLTEPVTPGGV